MDNLNSNNSYQTWLSDIKLRIVQSQIKASVKVNTELLTLYWDLGKEIVTKQLDAIWGSNFFEILSKDLKLDFPNIKGFSVTNLKYIKRFYLSYNQYITNSQQAVDEFKLNLFQIPWGHHIYILTKCDKIEDALFYIYKTIENGWSRSVLSHQIDTQLHIREGKSITNFSATLPKPQSDLANETLKNPYTFDFLCLTDTIKEKELEKLLTQNITNFLLELGSGFAFVGKQIPIKIGENDFYIDLLFYHLKLRCYVVVELKVTDFIPEFAGKLSFYISVINDTMKHSSDNPTIGLLICKNKNNYIVEYSLKDINQPIGVSEYQLSKLVPKDFVGSLPSIEEIEKELEKMEEC